MSRQDSRELCRDLAHYLGGRVAMLGLGMISFPILARLLPVAQYGVLSLVLKLAGVAAVLAKLGLQQALVRFHQEALRAGLARRYYSTLCLGTVLLAFLAGGLLAGSTGLAGLPAGWRQPLLLAALLAGIRGVQSILLGFLRAEQRSRAYNVADVLTRAASLAASLLLLFCWEVSVRAFLSGLVLAEGLQIALLLGSLAWRGLLRWTSFCPGLWRRLLAFALPLTAFELAWVVLDAGDRVLIQWMLGPAQLGYYSAACNIAGYVQESLMGPLSLALAPAYMKIWATRGAADTAAFLSRGMEVFGAAAAGILALTIVGARPAIVILGSRKYQSAAGLLPILVAALLVWSAHVFLNAGLLLHNRTGFMAGAVTAACVLKLSLTAALLKPLGLSGAALATLAGYGFLIALLARRSYACLPLKPGVALLARAALAGGAAALGGAWISVPWPVLELALRGAVTAGLYAVLLAALEPRLRQWCRRNWQAGWALRREAA